MKLIAMLTVTALMSGCSSIQKNSFEGCMSSDSAKFNVSDVMGSREYLGETRFKEELTEYCEFMSEGV